MRAERRRILELARRINSENRAKQAAQHAEMTQHILLTTKDPKTPSPFAYGDCLPAMTVLLHRVCNNDSAKFEEATRLVELFIRKALEKATD